MLTALHARRADGLTRLTQREPTWNEQLKSYQLDFDGRCALADDCNCILECEYAGAEAGKACAGPQVAFLLGRVDLKRGAAHRERALGRKEAADVRPCTRSTWRTRSRSCRHLASPSRSSTRRASSTAAERASHAR